MFALALAITLVAPATGYYPLLLLLLTDVLVRLWRRGAEAARPLAGRVGR